MNLNWAVLLGLIGIVLLIAGIAVKKKHTRFWLIIPAIIVLVGVVASYASPGFLPFLQLPLTSTGSGGGASLSVTGAGAGVTGGSSGGAVNPGYQPTLQTQAKDKYATTSISGTSYYQRNSNAATSTTLSNVAIGDLVKYWVDNVTGYYYVQPVVTTINSPTTTVTATAWKNGTATISLLDATGVKSGSVASGTANISAASGTSPSVNILYQGAYQNSAAPFGGAFVVEYNNTMSAVSCSGAALTSSNPFIATGGPTNPGKLQYTLNGSKANTFTTYYFGPSLDDGTATQQTINCKFTTGSTAPGAGSFTYFYFIPANYYLGIDGNIYLDLQKNVNGVNTLTGGAINQPNAFLTWGA